MGRGAGGRQSGPKWGRSPETLRPARALAGSERPSRPGPHAPLTPRAPGIPRAPDSPGPQGAPRTLAHSPGPASHTAPAAGSPGLPAHPQAPERSRASGPPSRGCPQDPARGPPSPVAPTPSPAPRPAEPASAPQQPGPSKAALHGRGAPQAPGARVLRPPGRRSAPGRLAGAACGSLPGVSARRPSPAFPASSFPGTRAWPGVQPPTSGPPDPRGEQTSSGSPTRAPGQGEGAPSSCCPLQRGPEARGTRGGGEPLRPGGAFTSPGKRQKWSQGPPRNTPCVEPEAPSRRRGAPSRGRAGGT
ncbi:translation initiation factor IF-2-like [Talpa occidentalis]|uniref:translation initiation factor IF-2-like n=1 Tax=Talpa occidentalis TaxID=50954 RepID=UPI00188E360F|nr:translation initiation factor IF-2-like [Talpa occidentalis]